MESKTLPLLLDAPTWRPPQRKNHFLLKLATLTLAVGTFCTFWHHSYLSAARTPLTCDQPQPLVPKPHDTVSVDVLRKEKVQKRAFEHLSGAIKINTVAFDEQRHGDPKDIPSAEGLRKFHQYLQDSYPLIHSKLTRHVVNEFSLVYVWKGTNETAGPPLMICAHMDTVPVLNDTIDLWKHDPWSGFIDEKAGFIWGRGAADTKATLTGSMEAVELLLEGGYTPQRTIILAYGHDEEVSGPHGAAKIAKFIMENLGLENKIGMLVDEGTGLQEIYGGDFALVSVGEKGYYDLTMTVKTSGGHSSIPPDHTSIGMLSDAIHALEQNPHPASLPDNSPYLQTLVCAATHAPDLDSWIRFAILHISEYRTAVISVLSADPVNRYLMKTSQAIDIVSGGHKVNALPEIATAIVNHRIAFDSNPAALEARVIKILSPIAALHNLNFTLISYDASAPPIIIPAPSHNIAAGNFILKPYDTPLEPAPISPSFGDAAWEVLAGTIHHTLSTVGKGKISPPKEGHAARAITVAPMLMPANTDTRHYWRLTKNIYRFGPFRDGVGVHTVNEGLGLDSYIDGIAFFHELIRNWNEQ
ncbi:hypothetical protein HDU97_008061 [Phlyctochytrium planicorne]|nr:hypothetical protein HDU97_008061 [Phlyctochytrium planicorne]